jgi:hypothetical protein
MAVEAEQRAWDEQGEDWNHEVFPLSSTSARCRAPMAPQLPRIRQVRRPRVPRRCAAGRCDSTHRPAPARTGPHRPAPARTGRPGPHRPGRAAPYPIVPAEPPTGGGGGGAGAEAPGVVLMVTLRSPGAGTGILVWSGSAVGLAVMTGTAESKST